MSATTRIRWQFSSRTLILLMLLLSPLFAYIASIKYESTHFRRALERVRPDFDIQYSADPNTPTTYNNLVQQLIDRDAYAKVRQLNWNGEHHVGPDVVPHIAQLRGVNSLRFSKHDWYGLERTPSRVCWSDSELSQLVRIPTLESLTIDGVFSTSAIDPLLDLPLYQLLLPDTPLDQKLANKLLRCQTLTSVGFNCEHAEKESMGTITQLAKLSHLTVCNAPASKQFFEPLVECRRLKAIMIYNSSLSVKDGEALARLKLLQVRLVGCKVDSGFFRPFINNTPFPTFAIYHDRELNFYSSRELSISFLEGNIATLNQNSAVKPASTAPLRGGYE